LSILLTFVAIIIGEGVDVPAVLPTVTAAAAAAAAIGRFRGIPVADHNARRLSLVRAQLVLLEDGSGAATVSTAVAFGAAATAAVAARGQAAGQPVGDAGAGF